jgi:hypothetical protein
MGSAILRVLDSPSRMQASITTSFFMSHFVLYKDNEKIGIVADLLGHETVETTRIYLQRSSDEQRELIDEIVDW